jgi:small subunit ribosomal protein S4e
MAKKGQRKGIKRSKAPASWRIARKEKKWTINPHPGPHDKNAIPLAFIVRDYLGYARTLREAKRILNERKVKINGKVRTDFRFPVGILDIVEIQSIDQCYRVLPDRNGRLELHAVTGKDTHVRPLKITGKHVVKGGKTQLAFHDGTTLQVAAPAAEKGSQEYLPSGTLLYDFESALVLEYFPFEKGQFAMITGGRNVSRSGRITSVKENMVEIEGEEVFRTLKDNVFVLGAKESAISLGD